MAYHYAALRGEHAHFEYKQQNRTLDIHVEPLREPSGEITGCIGIGLDIPERKENEEQIRHQATHDALTGLANYREFVDTLERELRGAERSHGSFTILLLDLDHLKAINDRLGHLVGNQALMRLAAVMKQHCRATDLAARYGGDEFAVVLINSDQRMAETVAGRIESCLRNDTEEPEISVSIGIGVYPRRWTHRTRTSRGCGPGVIQRQEDVAEPESHGVRPPSFLQVLILNGLHTTCGRWSFKY
jgi:diguanylate cyclase (GGDEF)-like protein